MRNYYDIQQLIVASGASLDEIFRGRMSNNEHGVSYATDGGGIQPLPDGPHPIRTQVGQRIVAQPMASAVPVETTTIKKEFALEESPLIYTYPGRKLVTETAVYCPECGIRVSKHGRKPGTYKGAKVDCIICPYERD